MATLKFNMADLRPLIAHTAASKEHSHLYGQRPQAGLILVKDEGIYLMSTGKEMLPKSPNGKTHQVAYAKGFDPYKDGDVWDATHEVSGDDFAELLPLSTFNSPMALAAHTCTITLTSKSVAVRFTGTVPGKLLKPKKGKKIPMNQMLALTPKQSAMLMDLMRESMVDAKKMDDATKAGNHSLASELRAGLLLKSHQREAIREGKPVPLSLAPDTFPCGICGGVFTRDGFPSLPSHDGSTPCFSCMGELAGDNCAI